MKHCRWIIDGWNWKMLLCVCILFNFQFSIFNSVWAQKTGSTPVKVSNETQMMQGRKYYVHIVEKGQTVYSIAKAYKVQSFDAIAHVDIHYLHPGDTVWLPFRGQFAESEDSSTPTSAQTIIQVDTVYVHVYIHDTTYIDVPYAVHDTTYIDRYNTTTVTDTVTLTKYVPVHDTTYINVPHVVHDTTYIDRYNTTTITDTVTLTEYVTVHDTTFITDTVTLTKYVPVHDTTYIDRYNTTTVTDTVTLTKYVPVHDTTYIDRYNTTTVTDTVKLTEYVHDTTYIDRYNTTTVTDTVKLTEYVPVHDTTYIDRYNTTTVTDTVTLTEYVPVHDTTYIDRYNTTTVTDTVTLTEYVTVHDTTYIDRNNTTTVTDTVTLTEYVTIHDTTYIDRYNTTTITDTVTLTEYVPVHDTTYIDRYNTTKVTDTVTLTKYVPVHDTTYIDRYNTTTITDTVTLTKYVPIHDTIIITDTVTLTKDVPVHDTTYIDRYNTTIVTDTVTLTEYVHDTTYIDKYNTTTVTDTVTLTKYVTVHDTTIITDTVTLTEYVPVSQPTTISDSPTTTQPQRQVGKTLKIALMMPLHLNEIPATKFDAEQRGKKNSRQFEFIEFYEGILLALEQLPSMGVNTPVELNVVDVTDNSVEGVENAFVSHNVAQSDVVVALLFRDAFAKAAELSRQAGVYIVNPMSLRSEICADNPYMVKIQPSLESQVGTMLDNMKAERPEGHLYIVYGGSAEKPVLNEVKRQLSERGDIKYTLFNWNQGSNLTSTLKTTPNCHVLSVYDQKADQMRVYTSNLLNRMAAIKTNSPTLYTLTDWTREYADIDFSQLQLLNYHTFSSNWDLSNNVHVDFLTSFRNRFGSEPTSALAATGYDLTTYIVYGLAIRNSRFWEAPGVSLPRLVHPLHLGRHQAGLENDESQLYRMEGLRFVPVGE